MEREITGSVPERLATLARQPGTLLARERRVQQVFHRAWCPTDRSIDVLLVHPGERLENDPRQAKWNVSENG